MDNDRTRQLIKKRDLGTLYENDQLNLQMVHGKCFPHYSEQMPTFLPTYKYNVGTDEYDTSEKNRIPAWCDRILTRANNLKQLHYDTAPLRFSDHRPVWGLFDCTVSVVAQAKKDQISSQLYAKRRAAVGSHPAGEDIVSDDESLIGHEEAEPGLPPASSDKRKWWLENGMPARSTVQPPSGHGLNPTRPANPFRTATGEPEWIKIDAPTNATKSSLVDIHGVEQDRASLDTTRGIPSRRAVPPPQPPRATPQSDGSYEPYSDDPNRVLKQTLRKPAPPKPNKPTLLRSESQQSAAPPSPRNVPTPPEPRRSQAATRNVTPNLNNEPGPPSLPARPPTGLMDDDHHDDDDAGMMGWKPLMPS
jgi:hypothetical protein